MEDWSLVAKGRESLVSLVIFILEAIVETDSLNALKWNKFSKKNFLITVSEKEKKRGRKDIYIERKENSLVFYLINDAKSDDTCHSFIGKIEAIS